MRIFFVKACPGKGNALAEEIKMFAEYPSPITLLKRKSHAAMMKKPFG